MVQYKRLSVPQTKSCAADLIGEYGRPLWTLYTPCRSAILLG
jgi:hypothetical protein